MPKHLEAIQAYAQQNLNDVERKIITGQIQTEEAIKNSEIGINEISDSEIGQEDKG